MRELGRNLNGDVVLLVNADEAAALLRLHKAVEGGTLNGVMWIADRGTMNFDLTTTFGVITAWTIARFRLDQMRREVDLMEAALGKVEPSKHEALEYCGNTRMPVRDCTCFACTHARETGEAKP